MLDLYSKIINTHLKVDQVQKIFHKADHILDFYKHEDTVNDAKNKIRTDMI